MKYLKEVLGP